MKNKKTKTKKYYYMSAAQQAEYCRAKKWGYNYREKHISKILLVLSIDTMYAKKG